MYLKKKTGMELTQIVHTLISFMSRINAELIYSLTNLHNDSDEIILVST